MLLLSKIDHRLFGVLQADLELLDLIVEKGFGVGVALQALIEVEIDKGVAEGVCDASGRVAATDR